ncbi:bifunctional 4-hydroxy-2-oxoglutarate aldolase/2-dehydro-3-deoxy-phosphogluconate aldolase [Arthrobacter sp. TMP15]|uniref:bifunctional 4-hydroxy-2-oxoglutarate aldolase/2-dehydro-3-deoxy-phosphogluconate aldolase n=1 Tax=Arthrobacter sp. TMP15 TaxID=3140789 RepID=UPI0031BB17C5
MGQTPEEFLNGVRDAKLVAIVRGTDSDAAVQTALSLMAEGFRYVEVALTTPNAADVIAAIRETAPDEAQVGAGTVLSIRDVADVVAAGAQFIVTPALAESIGAAVRCGLPVLAGAFTPTEVLEGMNRGATLVKLFPASVGGPRYLKALRDPFPDVPLIAVGGVGANDAKDYWDAGAVAVGPGSPLVGDAASGTGNLDKLRERARDYLRQAADYSPAEG